MTGDLNMVRNPFLGSYSNNPISCARCGHDGVPIIEFLPEEFYVRITNNFRHGDLD